METPHRFSPSSYLLPSVSKGGVLLATALCLFAVIAIIFFFALRYFTDTRVVSFETCQRARGSTVLFTYPLVCISATGKRFEQPFDGYPLSLVGTSPEYAPNQRGFAVASDSARRYTSTDGVYTLELPAGWVIRDLSDVSLPHDVYGAFVEIAYQSESAAYPFRRILLSSKSAMSEAAQEQFRSFFLQSSTMIGTTTERIGQIAFEKVELAEDGIYVDSFYASDTDKGLGIFLPYENDEDRTALVQIFSSIQFVRSENP